MTDTTPQQHIESADRALAAARAAMAEIERRWPDGSTSTEALIAHSNYIDLLQIINTHANLATAKTLLLLSQRSVPIEFAVPFKERPDSGYIGGQV